MDTPPYTATEDGDCDDKNSQIFPDASEVCNVKDDNCNGLIDEGAAIGCQDAWVDADGDNYGVGEKVCVCPGANGYADSPGDCNDDAVGVHPGALETCNGVNDDCAGGVDDPGAFGCQKHYLDADEDNFGLTTDSQCLCGPTGDYTAEVGGDCNDNDAEIYPGLIETCDEKDNNCNGQVDEGVKTTFYVDGDSDGYGAGFNSKEACEAPDGYVLNGGDCNDFNGAISPALSETCDDIDNNCNGQTDEGLPLTTVYVDLDGDGHGAKGTAGTQKCLRDKNNDGVGESAPDGTSLLADDCNDSASLTFPGAPELCDGELNDCTVQVADFQCPTTCQGVWPVAVGVTSGYVVAGQLNDTNPLEVVVQGGGTIRVLRDNGSELWSASAGVQYSNPQVADADLNGFLDVIAFENSKIRIFDGATGSVLESFTVTNSGWRPGIAFDLDNDGVMDLVGSGTNDKVAVILRDGAGGAKDTFYLTPPAGTYFNGDVAAGADLDGDGVAEIIIGTGYSTCNGAGAPACLGMLLVYDVLTGELKYPADTFEVPDAGNAYTGGSWPFVADLDNDGMLEIFHAFGNKVSGAKGLAWNPDGSAATMTTGGTGNLVVAPVDALGDLSDGSMRNTGGGSVDLDGDGRFELVYAGGNGLVVSDGGVIMNGYPAGAPGSASIATDINRDGRLDVLYVGTDDAAVHCMSLGEGTFALNRLLTSGARDGLAQGHYRMSSFDSFEPNDVASVAFDPASSTDPIVDSRAFPMRGFVDKYSSANGFSRALVSSLATAGDRDFYYAVGTQIQLSLTSLIGPTDHDLLMHIYYPDGANYEYITTFSSQTAGNEQIDCHSSLPCPDADHTGTKLFIIEVRGHDEAVDFGPWPYRLRINYGAK